jgi:aconitate hydratase
MQSKLSLNCKKNFTSSSGKNYIYFSLPELEKQGYKGISSLPICIRIILESMLRNNDGVIVTDQHIDELAQWEAKASRLNEIPFIIGRIVLNCAAGIPLLGDLAAMREAVHRQGKLVADIGPQVQVDMTLDHTLAVDYSGSPDALLKNMRLEIDRNEERFSFVKWAMQAFNNTQLIPPGMGILHQLNLEFFAPGLINKNQMMYPDTLVGTDSHTCMIAGLGTLGWGVGGIEALSATLGQPIYLLTPDVIGIELSNHLHPGASSTDLVLFITNLLRKEKVVGKFIEFFGQGKNALTIPDRATISNMAVEYGATVGFFPIDEQTYTYLSQTGRSSDAIECLKKYYELQNWSKLDDNQQIKYTKVITVDLSKVMPCVAGPKRPQDLVPLNDLPQAFNFLLTQDISAGGYGRPSKESAPDKSDTASNDGNVVIAAITSCTNTSNPKAMLTAGLLAKNARKKGLFTKPWVKTSLAPGSRVVGEYFNKTELQPYLDQLGFNIVGFSCTTCVGSSGPLKGDIEQQIKQDDSVVCAVLSGNRNFEGRIHPLVKASYLASPALVIAFALTGKIHFQFSSDPIGISPEGSDVFLKDIWPSEEDVSELMTIAMDPSHYQTIYASTNSDINPFWGAVPTSSGDLFNWNLSSSYIKEPPFLTKPELLTSSLKNYYQARALLILGDSITTDHISPIGNIAYESPAGIYLRKHGIEQKYFNNYGSRRMNHEIMIRGAFSNSRLKNKIIPGKEGGFTIHAESSSEMSIFDASEKYATSNTPLFIFAGEEYGTGSARDWAAKATRLLGVRAVIAKSFERIHRSNLIGLGVLPCQLPDDISIDALRLTGKEKFDLIGIDGELKPRQKITLIIERSDQSKDQIDLILRLDTNAEIRYANSGGILPYMMNELINKTP